MTLASFKVNVVVIRFGNAGVVQLVSLVRFINHDDYRSLSDILRHYIGVED